MSYRAAMKDSLCELKRSPVPECLLHRGWQTSNSRCLDNFVDFCAISTSHSPKFVLFIFFHSCGMDCGPHLQKRVTSLVSKQNSFHWVANVFLCLFLCSKLDPKAAVFLYISHTSVSCSKNFTYHSVNPLTFFVLLVNPARRHTADLRAGYIQVKWIISCKKEAKE